MTCPEPRLPNTPRPHIPAALSDRVYQRDGAACRYCGAITVPLELDHVFPFVQGGDATENNLVVSCRVCNLLASDRVFIAGFDQKRDWVLAARAHVGKATLARIDAALAAGSRLMASAIVQGLDE